MFQNNLLCTWHIVSVGDVIITLPLSNLELYWCFLDSMKWCCNQSMLYEFWYINMWVYSNKPCLYCWTFWWGNRIVKLSCLQGNIMTLFDAYHQTLWEPWNVARHRGTLLVQYLYFNHVSLAVIFQYHWWNFMQDSFFAQHLEQLYRF